MDGTTVATIPKNAREELRVTVGEYNDIPLIDVRVWTVPAVPGGDGQPTKKGLSLRPETWGELLGAIEAALGNGAVDPEPDEPQEDEINADEDPFADE